VPSSLTCFKIRSHYTRSGLRWAKDFASEHGWASLPQCLARKESFAYAAGGKGGPPPLHPRPRAAPLGIPIRCNSITNVRRTGLRAILSWQLMIQLLAYQSHAPMPVICYWHHLQGVWGAARHPSGEREGRSPLASWGKAQRQAAGSARGGARSHPGAKRSVKQRGARGAEPARIL
jgi:hypothetical protein